MTSKRRLLQITFVVFVVLLLGAASMRAYGISATWVSKAFCNQQECFVFVDQEYDGWSKTYLGNIGMIFRSLMGGATAPTQMTHAVLVFRITPTKIETYPVHEGPFPVLFWNSTIYSMSNKGDLKWAGTHFERLTPEEMVPYHDAIRTNHALAGEFSNQDGWSAKYLNVNHDWRVNLGGQEITISMSPTGTDGVSIDVAGVKDRPRGSIWTLDMAFRKVTESKYREIFGPS